MASPAEQTEPSEMQALCEKYRKVGRINGMHEAAGLLVELSRRFSGETAFALLEASLHIHSAAGRELAVVRRWK
jgi:hypothetical protein